MKVEPIPVIPVTAVSRTATYRTYVWHFPLPCLAVLVRAKRRNARGQLWCGLRPSWYRREPKRGQLLNRVYET